MLLRRRHFRSRNNNLDSCLVFILSAITVLSLGWSDGRAMPQGRSTNRLCTKSTCSQGSLCNLCDSVVSFCSEFINHRDTEDTEIAQRRARPRLFVQSPTNTESSDWPAYGNDPGGSRYSSLNQIDRHNVKELRAVWTYRTGDVADGSRTAETSQFEATPIMVEGTVYLSTPFNRVIALEP